MKKDKESGDLVPFNDNDLAYMKAQSGVDFNDIRSCEPGSSQMCMFDENDMKMSQISDNGFADSHTTVKYLNEDGSPSDRDVRFKDYNSARMATEKMIGTSSNNFYHMQKDILKVKVSTLNTFLRNPYKLFPSTRKKITDNLKAYFEGVKMA